MNEKICECLQNIRKKEITKEAVNYVLNTYYRLWMEIIETDEFPDEFTTPLIERESGIYEAVKWLSDNGFDMNEGQDDTPLMISVGYADAPMTEFLLKNGADANRWAGKDETPEDMRGNYYLEDIDIAYYNEELSRQDNYVQALLQTTRVLVELGNIGDFNGICLNVDINTREISLSDAKYKY